MSAQGVKKRLGSRRQVKNKSPEVDEFYNRETTVEEHGVTTEGAEDVHKFSNIRRKLGSSRKNKRPPPGKDLEVSDGAAENTPEDDLLEASQVSSSAEEVEVTHQVPRESHRGFELQQHEHGRDKKSATLTHDESLRDSRSLSESHVMAEEAELRTEAQPDEELEDLPPAGGVVQTPDLTDLCDKELKMKPADSEESQRRGGIEEVAPHVALKDQDSPSEGPVEGQQKPVQVSETVTDEGAQETSPSEPTNAELTSSDPSSSLCFQKTGSADPAMEVAGEHEPGSHLDDSLHFQQRSKQRRRKMGSTRWTNKSPEVRRAAVTENSDSAQASQEGVERPAEESGETNTEMPVKLPQDEANVTFDPQNTHSNLIARPEGVNPTILVDGSGLWGGNSREPSQLGAPPPSFQSTQDDQESPPEKQEQPLQSAEEATVGLEKERSQLEADEEHKDPEDPDKVAEGGYVNNLEPENAGPDLDTANGRRMVSSTCRSPTSLRKEEDLHHQQKMDDETADEQRGEGSSERRKEPVKDTHLLEPPPLQTSEEASTTSESDHQPTTSPENDVASDTFSSKRRRKLGSHRKSSRPQNHKTQTGSDVGSAAEHTLKVDEEDKISEVDEDGRNSANTSSSEAGGLVNPVSSSSSDLSSAPRTLVHPEGCLSPEDQPLPLAGDGKSNSYSVIMVGNSSVGKTSFMKRVLNGRFSSDLPSSVGLDMCLWPVTVDGKRVVLQLWDTAGQERFHSVTRQIFHKAHAFLLMYDITSTRSFTGVSYWANCIQEGATENVTILLLGNKSDCAKRQVPTQDGESLAKEYAFGFMECSAATGHNVKESLETVARILSNKVKPGKETTVLHKEPQQKKSSGCC